MEVVSSEGHTPLFLHDDGGLEMTEAVIISAVIAVVASVASTVIYWQRFKSKLSLVRRLIDSIDDAVKDDKVTDEEFERIWDTARQIIARETGKMEAK
jgi:uncharacterized membrane protein